MTKKYFLFSAYIIILTLFSVNLLLAENSVKPFNPDVQHQLVMIDYVHDYNLDPHTANDTSEAQILTALYEGLFTYHPYTMEPIPAIAESFKISRDKKTWTFYINKNALYSNGETITSFEVKRSWLTLLNPTTKAPFASLFDCIVGAKAYRQRTGVIDDVSIFTPNEYTLVVKLNTPTEYFNKFLCHYAFSCVPEDKNVYSGPFILESHTDTEILLKKNELYYDSKNVALPSILIRLSNDEEANTYDFNLGSVDWVVGHIQTPKIYDKRSILISPQFGTEFILFNTKNEPLNNPLVRNALLDAVPWEKIRENRYIEAPSLVLQIQDYPEVIGLGDTDMDEAKRKLNEAGFKDGGFSLKFIITEAETNIAELLKESWAELGITLEIVKQTTGDYYQKVETIDNDLYFLNWIGDFADPMAFLELFRSNSTIINSSWNNIDYDKLLNEASYINDSTKRYEKLAQAEQLLLDDGAIIPISHSVALNIIDLTTVGGWYPNALNIHPYKSMYMEETKTTTTFVKYVKP